MLHHKTFMLQFLWCLAPKLAILTGLTSLQKELENLESNDLKEWQGLISGAKKLKTDFLGQANGVEKELEERAKEFHNIVDEVLENSKRQLKELTISSIAVLCEQEKRVSDGLEKVKQEIKDCEDKLRNGDVESLLEHKSVLDRKVFMPNISEAVPPVLTTNQLDIKSLSEMFGELSVSGTTQEAEDHSQSSTEVYQDTKNPSVTEPVKGPTVPETIPATDSGNEN